ncbi:MAG: acyl-CoA dehydrogenase [Alphaproteobacteria bacterium]|nr:acyl-CoA dehydrogenase [Alphaproteobacteria bacterium]
MNAYTAPLADMRFVLNHVVGLDRLAGLPGLEVAGEPDLIDQILEEAGRFSAEVLAPLNQPGDQQGARIENGVVRPVAGFAEAYQTWTAAGWNGVPFAPEHGGQGLPWTVSTALWEMWSAANLSFSLCPLLTQAAIDALERHASPEQKAVYLDRLVSGEWTGTMNLTEPQSGTDLGTIRTRSERSGDHYLLRGQKIFITWGDHDMTDNIVHLVLARSPDGPPGTRGLSLFIVPKYLVGEDGRPGVRNDLRPVSIEHKIGIHASPTCVMSYGENGGAVGYLVGEENRGIEYMFVMMNNARMAVGLQGLAVADRAYQQAVEYARERVQGRPVQGADGAAPIIRHPDVRRMLLDMKSQIEAMRGLCYEVSAELDRAVRIEDPQERARSQEMVDLMIPVVKAWCTDVGTAITSTAIQVHGGMGFMEETGVGQHYRDVRITPIYEGTNGVQAMDLLGRKLMRDGGATARRLLDEVRAVADTLGEEDRQLAAFGDRLSAALDATSDAVTWLVETFPADPARASAAAAPFLEMMGLVAGGWMLARGMLQARRLACAPGADAGFLEAKVTTACYFAETHLVRVPALLGPVIGGGSLVMALAEDRF